MKYCLKRPCNGGVKRCGMIEKVSRRGQRVAD